MPPTPTTHQTTFHRPPPSPATFSFPHPSSPAPFTTSITIPPSSPYTTSPHWHATHTEYLRVISGAALVTVGGESKIYTATAEGGKGKKRGEVCIPPLTRHEWTRFDRPAHLLSKTQREAQERFFLGLQHQQQNENEEEIESLKAQDLIVEEWTYPSDGEKEMFFRNLFSTASEKEEELRVWWLGGGLKRTLQIMCVMWELDNYPVFVDLGGGRVEAVVTYAVMGCAVLVGRWGLGCRGVRGEYTPDHLLRRWEGRRGLKGE